MRRNKDDIIWRKGFSRILKIIFSIYDFSYEDFAAYNGVLLL